LRAKRSGSTPEASHSDRGEMGDVIGHPRCWSNGKAARRGQAGLMGL
jgi:hypothetical protein